MYAAKIITPSKRNIKESTTVFLLLFSGSVSWKACTREKKKKAKHHDTHKKEYTDKECQLHKPVFISINLSTSISLSKCPGLWNQAAINFLLRARKQSSFPFNLHLPNSFLQLQLLFLLSSASHTQFHQVLSLVGHFTNIYPFFLGSTYMNESHPESYIGITGWASGRLRTAMCICKKNLPQWFFQIQQQMQDGLHLRWQQQSLPAVHTATQACSEPGFLSKAQQGDFLPTGKGRLQVFLGNMKFPRPWVFIRLWVASCLGKLLKAVSVHSEWANMQEICSFAVSCPRTSTAL